MRNAKSCLLFFFLLYSCATTISGVVLDEANKPVKSNEGKVNIHLLSASKSPMSIVVDIDESGEFSTSSNLVEGEYLVEPLIPGYRSNAVKLKLVDSQKLTLQTTKLKAVKASIIGTSTNSDVGKGAGEATLTPPNL